MKTTTYNAAYFIAKFEAIPEELWGENQYEADGKLCAYGHCGERNNKPTEESSGLSRLNKRAREVLDTMGILFVNDNENPRYQQDTPKQRVLAFLKDAQEAGL